MHFTSESKPSALLREAKGLAQDFKKSLKSSQPSDRSIEIQRENLRRLYLQAVFNSEDGQADLAEQLLWSETSHALIDIYRSKIQVIERAIAVSRTEQGPANRTSVHGPVELRKVVQTFRSFLANEETFWRQFCLRFVRSFSLEEARPILAAACVAEEVIPGDQGLLEAFLPRTLQISVATRKRPQKMEMLQRSVIYLGDLARYRELTDVLVTPKSGKARVRREHKDVHSETKDFAKAEAYYRAARLLSPEIGAPFNQLAIIAMYQSRHFDALYYYYRAACTTHPFATIGENIDRLLTKTLDSSRRSKADHAAQLPSSHDHPGRIDVFKQDILLLHALWGRSSGSNLRKQSANVEDALPGLIRDRVLPADIIYRTVIMVLGALWRSRTNRPPSSQDVVADTPPTESPAEAQILSHLLSLLSNLMRVGQDELSAEMETPIEEGTSLALRISAVLRRVLGPLRVCSKWLNANFDYVSRLRQAHPDIAMELERISQLYLSLSDLISRMFPIEVLPTAAGPLDEDLDMRGFLPCKRLAAAPASQHSELATIGSSQVHPNEEHLMRIADLWSDARHFSHAMCTPAAPAAQSPRSAPTSGHLQPSGISETTLDARVTTHSSAHESHDLVDDAGSKGDFAEREDDVVTVSTSTEDDPVNLAMRAALDQADGVSTDDENDELILFPRPVVATRSSASGVKVTDSVSPRASQQISGSPATTAQDLLLQVLGSSEAPTTPQGASVTRSRSWKALPQPALLFGSGSNLAASIWSEPLRQPYYGGHAQPVPAEHNPLHGPSHLVSEPDGALYPLPNLRSTG